jgi:hypothetical protein
MPSVVIPWDEIHDYLYGMYGDSIVEPPPDVADDKDEHVYTDEQLTLPL